jgi:hypothetical protein
VVEEGAVRTALTIDVFRVRESSLETYLPWLDEQWRWMSTTGPNSGDVSSTRVSPDAFGWSASGRHIAEEPTKSTPAR